MFPMISGLGEMLSAREVLEEAKSQLMERGQAFDPELHEAVSQQETTDVEEGVVVQQLRKGYRLHERLVRPASVVVAKAPVTESEEAGS